MTSSFVAYLERYQHRVNESLHLRFAALKPTAPRLLDAMRYSLFANGKRVRPVLAYAAAEAIDQVSAATDAVACALEAIHTYSLIHDDLPAMDNDDLRRGAPTCHIAFDEATAILAGDGLQALAFEWLADCPGTSAEIRLALIAKLGQSAGCQGMVAGQDLDLAAVGKRLQLPELEKVHRFKTGALIRASVAMGALATGKATPVQLNALDEYAQAIGLAFQVQDDILDVIGDPSTMGKHQGADAALDKPTYVSLLGLDEARAHLATLHQQALDALANFPPRADPLRQLADYVVQRTS